MPTPTSYNYTKEIVPDQLASQIASSSIAVALDHISTVEDEVTIFFKDVLSETDETTLADLVTNFVAAAPAPSFLPVQTAFETTGYTLKIASMSGDVGEDGLATCMIKIPGTPGTDEGRWLNGGTGFFDDATPGDKVLGIWFVDHDNILGNGVDFIVGSYTEDEADSENQGWFIPPKRGMVEAETIGFYGFAPAGFYIKIVAKKAGESPTGKFYCNFEWAVKA